MLETCKINSFTESVCFRVVPRSHVKPVSDEGRCVTMEGLLLADMRFTFRRLGLRVGSIMPVRNRI